MENVVKTNMVNVIGTLVEVKDSRTGSYTSAEGKEVEYASAKLVVKVEENDTETLVEVDNFSRKMKSDGSGVSKFYKDILVVDSMLNKKISITSSPNFDNATINGNRFWSTAKKEVINSTRIGFRSYNAPFKNQEDTANFTFAGFVYSELEAVEDGDGNIAHYTFSLGQATYGGKLAVIPFVVDKDNTAAIKSIQNNFKKGKTFVVGGHIRTKVVEREVEDTGETMFGTAIPQSLPPMVFKQFVVTTADVPAPEAAYTIDQIKELAINYKEEAAAIQAKAEAEAKAGDSKAAAKTEEKEVSLDDFI